jgi:hypothetical protein
LVEILETEIPTWNLKISLDQLLPTLDLAEHSDAETSGLRHDPPKILIRYDPAVLITIDGRPEYEDIERTDLQRVVNTPYVIVRDSKDFYSGLGQELVPRPDILGPWSITSQLPSECEEDRRRARETAQGNGSRDRR